MLEVRCLTGCLPRVSKGNRSRRRRQDSPPRAEREPAARLSFSSRSEGGLPAPAPERRARAPRGPADQIGRFNDGLLLRRLQAAIEDAFSCIDVDGANSNQARGQATGPGTAALNQAS